MLDRFQNDTASVSPRSVSGYTRCDTGAVVAATHCRGSRRGERALGCDGVALPGAAVTRYAAAMTPPAPLIEDDEAAAEAPALAAAIAESDADPRTVPHEDVRAWLLRLAQGEFDAPPPRPRLPTSSSTGSPAPTC